MRTTVEAVDKMEYGVLGGSVRSEVARISTKGVAWCGLSMRASLTCCTPDLMVKPGRMTSCKFERNGKMGEETKGLCVAGEQNDCWSFSFGACSVAWSVEQT